MTHLRNLCNHLDVLQSPVASDRFSSPAPGNAKRRLFTGTETVEKLVSESVRPDSGKSLRSTRAKVRKN